MMTRRTDKAAKAKPIIIIIIIIIIVIMGVLGSVVVKALYYKPEVRRFVSRRDDF
jgi:flagellar basal body-associated protein FliL